MIKGVGIGPLSGLPALCRVGHWARHRVAELIPPSTSWPDQRARRATLAEVRL